MNDNQPVMTNPTLQSELEQILNNVLQGGMLSGREFMKSGGMNESLQAILATVSKHLPEKATAPLDCCDNEGGAVCWKETKVNARNTAIAEMEKTLGGSV